MLDILGGGSSVSDNCGVDDTLYLSESDFTIEWKNDEYRWETEI